MGASRTCSLALRCRMMPASPGKPAPPWRGPSGSGPPATPQRPTCLRYLRNSQMCLKLYFAGGASGSARTIVRMKCHISLQVRPGEWSYLQWDSADSAKMLAWSGHAVADRRDAIKLCTCCLQEHSDMFASPRLLDQRMPPPGMVFGGQQHALDLVSYGQPGLPVRGAFAQPSQRPR